jgi:hypothetical protein
LSTDLCVKHIRQAIFFTMKPFNQGRQLLKQLLALHTSEEDSKPSIARQTLNSFEDHASEKRRKHVSLMLSISTFVAFCRSKKSQMHCH